MNKYKELAAIDVSKHVEQKGPHKLAYLSWPFAVDFLMKADPSATWQFHEPQEFSETLMVSCTVTAFGKPMTMHLPVMDHSNKAIKNPNAFDVNKSMMRCLVKAIACHGLGISVYAGEDLPDEPTNSEDLQVNLLEIQGATNEEELKVAYSRAVEKHKLNRGYIQTIVAEKDRKKRELGNPPADVPADV